MTRRAVGDHRVGEGGAGSLPVGGGVTEPAQQVLEEAVVVEDELDDVS